MFKLTSAFLFCLYLLFLNDITAPFLTHVCLHACFILSIKINPLIDLAQCTMYPITVYVLGLSFLEEYSPKHLIAVMTQWLSKPLKEFASE